MEVTNGFFIPTKIDYSVVTFTDDIYPTGVFNFKKSAGFVKRVIECDEGITFDMLKKDVDSVVTPEGLIRYIGDFSIIGKTKFILNDGEKYIGGIKEKYAMKDQDGIVSENETIFNLLRIDVIHTLSKGGRDAEPDEPAYYQIEFWTIAGVYFKDTDLGRANRGLLRNVFKRLFNEFTIVNTLFMSDRYSEQGMESVAFGSD